MSAQERIRIAQYLAAMANVKVETAVIWLTELVDREGLELVKAERLISVVVRRRNPGRQIELAEFTTELRTGALRAQERDELDRKAQREIRALPAESQASREARLKTSERLARAAAQLALSGETKGQTEAQVQERLKTLQTQALAVVDKVSAETEARRAKAAKLAAAEVRRPDWYETEAQIRERVGR